ncbi:MAG: response regulator [Blastocatellia bacterium]
MILFIDDEDEMESFELGLKLSEYEYQVKRVTNVDDAWEYLNCNEVQIKLIIMDIMIPPGDLFNDVDTKGGLRTGLDLLEKIREKNNSLPVIVFSNVSDQKIISHFQRQPKCLFLRKEEEGAFTLPHKVHQLLKDS